MNFVRNPKKASGWTTESLPITLLITISFPSVQHQIFDWIIDGPLEVAKAWVVHSESLTNSGVPKVVGILTRPRSVMAQPFIPQRKLDNRDSFYTERLSGSKK